VGGVWLVRGLAVGDCCFCRLSAHPVGRELGVANATNNPHAFTCFAISNGVDDDQPYDQNFGLMNI
jgi:hypothetical protein